jgi:uncharacterized protein
MPQLCAAATTLVLLVVAALFLPQRATEPTPAPPARWFNDDAKLVSPAFAAAKNQYIMTQRRAQIVVVTRPGVPEGALETWAARAVTSWQLGADRRDNGLVLIVLPDARAIRLEIGYGLEAALPDVEAGRLVDDTLVPAFERGHYEAGFDDFLSVLYGRLDALPSDAPIVGLDTGMLHFALAVARQAPRFASDVRTAFLTADLTGRIVLSLFGAVFVAVAGYLLRGILAGVVALVQLPWRLAHAPSLHALDRATLAAEFAPAAFVKRPPPSLVAVVRDLGLVSIGYGLFCAVGVVVVTAFLAVGSDVFVPARGQFGGAGVTRHWSAP